MSSWLEFFKPPKAVPQLPAEQVDRAYHRNRIMIFSGIFLGYGVSYLVRNMLFSLAMPHLSDVYGFDKKELGVVLTGFSIAYGFSKFLMGNLSDRSNPKYFLATGLIIPILIALIFGHCHWAYSSIMVMFILMFISGWGNGMCYPPCVRVLAHWYSIKERGLVMSAWNISHNLGGCLVAPLAFLAVQLTGQWQSIFYAPAMVAAAFTVVVLFTVKDTPQSIGLPSIEDYHSKRYLRQVASVETSSARTAVTVEEGELSAKEIFFKHICNNRAIWFLSFANIFVYFVRFGVASWIPLYLKEVKDFNFKGQAIGVLLFELAGIPAMMMCGYLSDKFFRNRRVPVIVISTVLTIFAILLYWLNPPGHKLIDNLALIGIGFLIYGPVVMIGMQAVDVVYKKAVGTATGLTGFFGYMFGTAGANALMGYVVHYWGWDAGFMMLIASCVLAILFLIPIWFAGGEE